MRSAGHRRRNGRCQRRWQRRTAVVAAPACPLPLLLLPLPATHPPFLLCIPLSLPLVQRVVCSQDSRIWSGGGQIHALLAGFALFWWGISRGSGGSCGGGSFRMAGGVFCNEVGWIRMLDGWIWAPVVRSGGGWSGSPPQPFRQLVPHWRSCALGLLLDSSARGMGVGWLGDSGSYYPRPSL
jgi:hypothetical protein